MNHAARSIFLKATFRFAVIFALSSLGSLAVFGQSTATLRGTVSLSDSGKPIHNVLVTILQLKRTVDTDDNGKYEFQGVPPGRYEVARAFGSRS